MYTVEAKELVFYRKKLMVEADSLEEAKQKFDDYEDFEEIESDFVDAGMDILMDTIKEV